MKTAHTSGNFHAPWVQAPAPTEPLLICNYDLLPDAASFSAAAASLASLRTAATAALSTSGAASSADDVAEPCTFGDSASSSPIHAVVSTSSTAASQHATDALVAVAAERAHRQGECDGCSEGAQTS